MTKFKHKNGGTCEVLTKVNIDRLRKDSNYSEILDKKKETKNEESKTLEENKKSKENK